MSPMMAPAVAVAKTGGSLAQASRLGSGYVRLLL
jgi:hypothetical protein